SKEFGNRLFRDCYQTFPSAVIDEKMISRWTRELAMAAKPFGKDSMTICVRQILLLLLICAVSSSSSAQSSTSNLEELATERQWVELREVAGKSEHATFYRAMAAAVFNESEAESLFMSIIRT